jgi:hypothetical protein
MSSERKTAEAREKDLRLAIARIQRRRAKTGEKNLTFAAVAHEASVSTALIHNCYPAIAVMIRDAQGRSSRKQRDDKRKELKGERERSRELRAELDALRVKVAMLASINEALQIENLDLRARLSAPNVVHSGRLGPHTP